MSYYLKGIGDVVTGKNEITPQFDAKINKFVSVNNAFVVGSDEDRFAVGIISRGVTIGPGMACAYGYYGMSDTTVQFNFVIPSSSTQYAKIYAEFDLSSSPQNFSIKATPQSSSNVIDLTQDNLSTMPTGKYQLELYLITIQSNGTIRATDSRVIKETIGKVESSLNTENSIYETNGRKYRPIKYDSSSKNIYATLSGVSRDEEVKIPCKTLVWRSPYWYGAGTKIPGNNYLQVDFDPQKLYGEPTCYEIVFDYEGGLPTAVSGMVKIPSYGDQYYEGGRMHIFITPFTAGAGQPNILVYPLGTLKNWANHDDCGSGSALLICPSYLITGKDGFLMQYIERVGNSNQAQNECSLIEIYAVYY